jgi:hypothetical protein
LQTDSIANKTGTKTDLSSKVTNAQEQSNKFIAATMMVLLLAF